MKRFVAPLILFAAAAPILMNEQMRGSTGTNGHTSSQPMHYLKEVPRPSRYTSQFNPADYRMEFQHLQTRKGPLLSQPGTTRWRTTKNFRAEPRSSFRKPREEPSGESPRKSSVWNTLRRWVYGNQVTQLKDEYGKLLTQWPTEFRDSYEKNLAKNIEIAKAHNKVLDLEAMEMNLEKLRHVKAKIASLEKSIVREQNLLGGKENGDVVLHELRAAYASAFHPARVSQRSESRWKLWKEQESKTIVRTIETKYIESLKRLQGAERRRAVLEKRMKSATSSQYVDLMDKAIKKIKSKEARLLQDQSHLVQQYLFAQPQVEFNELQRKLQQLETLWKADEIIKRSKPKTTNFDKVQLFLSQVRNTISNSFTDVSRKSLPELKKEYQSLQADTTPEFRRLYKVAIEDELKEAITAKDPKALEGLKYNLAKLESIELKLKSLEDAIIEKQSPLDPKTVLKELRQQTSLGGVKQDGGWKKLFERLTGKTLSDKLSNLETKYRTNRKELKYLDSLISTLHAETEVAASLGQAEAEKLVKGHLVHATEQKKHLLKEQAYFRQMYLLWQPTMNIDAAFIRFKSWEKAQIHSIVDLIRGGVAELWQRYRVHQVKKSLRDTYKLFTLVK